MHSLLHQSLTRESFSRSFFRYSFSPFLNKCQLFMSKDFWNLPVNPVRRVPGFMKERRADNEHSNPVLLPLVPEFTNIWISHLQFLHFQNFFVRSRCDWEKKRPDRNPTIWVSPTVLFYIRIQMIKAFYLVTMLWTPCYCYSNLLNSTQIYTCYHFFPLHIHDDPNCGYYFSINSCANRARYRNY